MSRLNFFINLLNLFLIFIYFINLNINLMERNFEYFLIFLILFNSIVKFYNWTNLEIKKKKNPNIFINNFFYNDRFTKLSIFILSIVIPLYMIFQKDNLIMDLFIEKLSFFLVFVFSIIGFYLEFFVLESKLGK